MLLPYLVIFLIVALIWTIYFLFKELKRTQYILKARDEWILLLMEREMDPKAFCEKYKKEPLDKTEYYYLHKYYTENKDEDVVTDANSVQGLRFPTFWFNPKIFD